MPLIFIKDYFWKQNGDQIIITLPLQKLQPSKVDVFHTDEFLKVHSHPFIFECLFFQKVDSTKTKCIFEDNQMILEMCKTERTQWPTLNQSNISPRKLIQLKQQIIKQEQIKNEERIKENENAKQERRKLYSSIQMDIHNKEKKLIEQAKEKEKLKGLQKLSTIVANKNKNLDEQFITLPVPVPFPRKEGIIKFNFSLRHFKTPKRESMRAEEEEWLKKDVEARRVSGFVTEDLSDDERNPCWLLEKGLFFMKNENYFAAINAFSYAIQLAPKMPVLYTQLGRAHIQTSNFEKAIENTSKALELLVPAVPQNKDLRIETYSLRANAFTAIEQHELCKKDLDAISKLK